MKYLLTVLSLLMITNLLDAQWTRLEDPEGKLILLSRDSLLITQQKQQDINNLHKQGYPYVCWMPKPARGDTLRLRLVPGEIVTLVRQWVVEQSDTILQQQKVTKYRPSLIRETLTPLLEDLQQDGYLFAELHRTELILQQDSLRVGWRLQRGEPVRITQVYFTGNEQTGSEYLRRYCRFRAGEIYSPRKWLEAWKHLQRLAWLTTVSEPQLVRLPDHTNGLLFKVSEAPTYRLNGQAGYLSRDATGGDGYWIYQVDMDLQNILGSGRELQVRSARLDPWSQSLLLSYYEPYIRGWPVSLRPQIEQVAQDSSWLERELDLTVEVEPDFRLTLLAGVQSRELFSDSITHVRSGILNEQGISWHGGVRYDTRDQYPYPGQGYLLQYHYNESVRTRWQPWLSPADGESGRLWMQRVSMTLHQRLGAGSIFNLKLEAAKVSSSEVILPPDRLPLGGAESLRGYRERQFLADEYGSGSVEWTLLIQGGDIHLFTDAAIMEAGSERQFLLGYGAGIRLMTRQGILGVDYAIPRQEGLSAGKIHLIYENRF